MRISRNDNCPCGSGSKYKKCCQERVEEFTGRLLQAMGVGILLPDRRLRVRLECGVDCNCRKPGRRRTRSCWAG